VNYFGCVIGTYFAEVAEVAPYEEMALYYPQPNQKRPLILVGPPSIGRHELRQRLLDDTSKFAAPVPRRLTNVLRELSLFSVNQKAKKHQRKQLLQVRHAPVVNYFASRNWYKNIKHLTTSESFVDYYYVHTKECQN